MAKPRAQTIQQRFGFQDGDLKTPLHDEIMLWLDSNIEAIVKSIIPTELMNLDWAKRQGCPEAILSTPPLPPEILNTMWEKPIMNKQYIIGFIDFVAYYAISELMEYPKGQWSVVRSRHRGKPIYFEVKSAIPSLGELIRQIRMYQQYLKSEDYGPFVVICPDTRFKEALAKQKIKLIEYKATPIGLT